MRRLVAADLLPERAGQPVKALVHVSLADLLMLEGSSALLEERTASVRARAIACDASVAPVVTGDVNPGALDDLIRLCVQLDTLRHHHGAGVGAGDGSGQDAPVPDTARASEALEQAVIGKAVDLLSGPGGLASFLRRRQLGVRLGGPSLPLDVGYSATIPAGIRDAVILRDRYCQRAGRCHQPASACEVHHVRHKKDGGKTSLKDCILLWLVLNPDGTTTAWNKDKTKVLHDSHSHSHSRGHSSPAQPG